MFQFLIVRLKFCFFPAWASWGSVSIPYSTIKIFRQQISGHSECRFQFLIVRLKWNVIKIPCWWCFVSIPYSTIKIRSNSCRNRSINSVSIPYSTIKMDGISFQYVAGPQFQFLIVRLKCSTSHGGRTVQNGFNSL